MFCGQCGKKNDDEKAYCAYCGSPLKPEIVWEEEQETYIRPERDPYSIYSNDFSRADNTEREQRRERVAKATTKESFSPMWIIVLFEFLLLIAILVFGYMRIKASVSPGTVADEFEEAFLNGNWGTAYEYLDVEDEEGLKKDDFINANINKEVGKIKNLEVTKTEEEALSDDEIAGPDVQYFDVSYFEDGEHKSERIMVEKTGSKAYGFFDEWKIAANDLYGKDVSVTIPYGSRIVMNERTPEEEYLQEIPDGETSTTETYIIPNMFYGDYQIAIEKEGYETYKDSKIYQQGEGFDYSSLHLQPGTELQKKVFDQLVGDWPSMWNAALNRSDFSLIQDYFCSESIANGSVQAKYEEVSNQSYSPEQPGYSSVEISNVVGEYVPSDRSDEIGLHVTGKVSKTFTENGQSTVDTYDFSENFTYRLENGVWKLVQFPYV